MTVYSMDLVKYTMAPGTKGKNLATSPKQLADATTLTQLNRFSENMGGKRYSNGTAKLLVAKQLFEVLEVKFGEKVLPFVKKEAPLVKNAAEVLVKAAVKNNKEKRSRAGFQFDVRKFTKDSDVAPFISGLFSALIAKYPGQSVINCNKETILSCGFEGKKKGNIWLNFIWYKSQGKLTAFAAEKATNE